MRLNSVRVCVRARVRLRVQPCVASIWDGHKLRITSCSEAVQLLLWCRIAVCERDAHTLPPLSIAELM